MSNFDTMMEDVLRSKQDAAAALQKSAQDAQFRLASDNGVAANQTARAAALLDTTNARLRPGESAASVARTNADTGLTNLQAQYYPRITEAQIGEVNARTGLTNTQGTALQRLTAVDYAAPDDSHVYNYRAAQRPGVDFSGVLPPPAPMSTPRPVAAAPSVAKTAVTSLGAPRRVPTTPAPTLNFTPVSPFGKSVFDTKPMFSSPTTAAPAGPLRWTSDPAASGNPGYFKRP